MTLWEIWSYGATPYPEVNTKEIYSHLKKGRRLTQPINCPAQIYGVMTRCWMENAEERPDFIQIKDTLNSIDESKIEIGVESSTSRINRVSDQETGYLEVPVRREEILSDSNSQLIEDVETVAGIQLRVLKSSEVNKSSI